MTLLAKSRFRPLALVLMVASLGVLPLLAQRDNGAAKAPVHVKTAQELQSNIAQVDKMFADTYAQHPLASVTVGVISGDKLVWTKSYGMADIENKVPATKDTTYRIGSITKQFTGTMLVQLVQQGKVHYSDPVKKYYPEFEQIPNAYPYAPPITLLQLATHTSGLQREPDDIRKYTTGQVADWDKILLSALPHLKFEYEPGTRFSYSNLGYAILGEALSRAAGEPYTQYVQEHILKPLGMTHSAFEQNPEILRTLAKGYEFRGDTPDPGPPAVELRNGRGYKVPNGALFTTVADLARFVSFEMADGPESVLPHSVELDRLSRAYSVDGEMKSGYGIGFQISRDGETIMMGHGGSVAGYLAGAYFNLPAHLGFIWLHNGSDHQFSNKFDFDVMKALLQ